MELLCSRSRSSQMFLLKLLGGNTNETIVDIQEEHRAINANSLIYLH